MDPSRFDSLARSLALPKSRRGFLAGLAAVGAGLLGSRAVDAQVSQASCGNQMCASNPAVCTNGCVCCVYTNSITGTVINSRCRPPGTCAPGTQSGGVTPTTTTSQPPVTTTVAPATTAQPTTTAAPTTTQAPATTTTTTTTTAPTCVGIEPGTPQCVTSANCPSGRTCINGGCFASCPTANARCDTGTPCPACFCDPPAEGGGLFCGDFNYVIGTCQNSAECPPGSFCLPEGRCTRPCPTLQ